MKTFSGKFRKSDTEAVTIKGTTRRTLELVAIAERDFFSNVTTMGINGEVNSIKDTVRGYMRNTNFSMIGECVKRNIKRTLRRTPSIPGFKATKHNAELYTKVALTVRPVMGINSRRMCRLPSN